MSAATRKSKARKAKSADVMTDEDLWTMFTSAQPLITEDWISACEKGMRAGAGIDRRIAHSVANKSGEQLIEMMKKVDDEEDGAKTMAMIIASIRRHKERSVQLADIASTTLSRIEMVLCVREDYEAVLKQSEAMTWAEPDTDVAQLRPN
ncbi:MAG TPA: hypothetical protein PJ986_14745 [Gammaproteobacteria bacterium]|nr:hypothetical protein [Gammaproteobacteria bacterium]